ncbi:MULTISPECIES: imm11 family protein [unclassified Myxococcus]|uniref:imm11 family protein n=1 Tax=unclassified Myxococcus TaxID=2648731 RepID=UPI00157A6AAF|nr:MULTISPECIES: DUF1629 domain-containing protein [unclassified Myxococcus]NTX37178.1 hypothetical protein [Myxococcus sp. CA033]NTX52112.1 hypothetical protein [Myxococcus sp. CA039A]
MTTNTHQYFYLTQEETVEYCFVNEFPSPMKGSMWPASEGTSMAANYPTGVRLNMARRHRGIVVPDFIPNSLLVYLITGRLKALLDKEAGAEIEYLPFALWNHKGRVAAEGCFIANLLGVQDCVDLKKTRGEKSIMSPGEFQVIKQLYLDLEKVPKDARLFRISVMPRFFVIRDDLRAILDQNGVTGIRYVAMGEKGYFV